MLKEKEVSEQRNLYCETSLGTFSASRNLEFNILCQILSSTLCLIALDRHLFHWLFYFFKCKKAIIIKQCSFFILIFDGVFFDLLNSLDITEGSIICI